VCVRLDLKELNARFRVEMELTGSTVSSLASVM